MGVTSYYSFGGEIIGEETGGVRRDYLTDALGSVTATVTGAGTVENTYRYKPYGEQLAKTGVGSDPKFLWAGVSGYRFSGIQVSDTYVRHRHYTNKLKLWTSKDSLWPIEHEYQYCNSSPVQLLDPTGFGSDFPLPLGPGFSCDITKCGVITKTRNTRFTDEKSRPGQTITIDVKPGGIGAGWSGTSRVVTHDVLWTVAAYKCMCNCEPPKWVKIGENHCKGTHLKEDITLPNMTFIIRDEYYGSGSPECPKFERVGGFVGNLRVKICLLLGYPKFICDRMSF